MNECNHHYTGNMIKTYVIGAKVGILFAVLSIGSVWSFAGVNEVYGQLLTNDRDDDGTEDQIDLCPDDYWNECNNQLPGINADSGIDWEADRLRQEAIQNQCENSAQIMAGVDYYECTKGSQSVTTLPSSRNMEVGAESGGASATVGRTVPEGVETTTQTTGDKSRFCNELADQVQEQEMKECLANPENYDHPVVNKQVQCYSDAGNYCTYSDGSYKDITCDQPYWLPWSDPDDFYCQYRDIGPFTEVEKDGHTSIVR